ncbi:MAG: hypothetical protein LBS99_07160, partial [Clostridiales bacterium]|nr:hypothetical protein [Clostridiales bacterium]
LYSTAFNLTKYESDGIEITVIRDGGRFYLFYDGVYVYSKSVTASAVGVVAIQANGGMTCNAKGIYATTDSAVINSTAGLGLDMDIQTAGNGGTVTPGSESYRYGDTVVLTVTPDTDYMLGSLTVNGTNVTAGIVGGTYTIVNYSASRTVTVAAVFEEIPETTYAVTVTATKAVPKLAAPGYDVTDAPGATATINVGGTPYSATASGNVYSFAAIPETASATLTITLPGYASYTQNVAVDKDLTGTYALTAELQYPVFNGANATGDYSRQGYGELKSDGTSGDQKYVFNGLSSQTSYMVKATFKDDATHSGAPQGFDIGGTGFLVRIVYNSGTTWLVQVTDWDVWVDALTFTTDSETLTKYQTTGLEIMLIRSGTGLRIFVDDILRHSRTVSAAAGDVAILGADSVKLDVKGIYATTDSAVINSTAGLGLNVDVQAADNGTVTPGSAGYKYGDNVVFTITPDTDYMLGSLTVNGTNVTSSVVGDTYTINNYTASRTVTVVAVFEEIPDQTYTVSGSYSYAAGLYGAGDTVTVSSGIFTGAVNLTAKTYTIDLPDGANAITLGSARFESKSVNVTVSGAATSASAAVFSRVKLENYDGVTDDGTAFTVPSTPADAFKALAGAQTAAGNNTFAIEAFMKHSSTVNEWNAPRFFVETEDGKRFEIAFVVWAPDGWLDIQIIADKPWVGTGLYGLNYQLPGGILTNNGFTAGLVYESGVLTIIVNQVVVGTLNISSVPSGGDAPTSAFASLFDVNQTKQLGICSRDVASQYSAIRWTFDSADFGLYHV